MVRTMGEFHHRVERWLSRNIPKHWPDGVWEYPPISEAMQNVVIEEVKVYIVRCPNKVEQFIDTRPIMNLK